MTKDIADKVAKIAPEISKATGWSDFKIEKVDAKAAEAKATMRHLYGKDGGDVSAVRASQKANSSNVPARGQHSNRSSDRGRR
jgi:hypothetical protein